MNDGKIHIKAGKAHINRQGKICLTPLAARMLEEIANESTMSIRQVASEIIIQAVENKLISFDRDGAGNGSNETEE